MNKIKEWFDIMNDVEEISEQAIKAFTKWYKANITITHGSGRDVVEIFGLPYTSTSEWAGLWNCQGEAYLNEDPQWKFNCLAISEDMEILADFDREDTGHFDNKDIVIGRIEL